MTAADSPTPLERALADADRTGMHVLCECRVDGGCIDMRHCPPGTQLVAAGLHLPAGSYLAVLPCYGDADEGQPERHHVDARREEGSELDTSAAPPHARLVASVGVRMPAGSGIVLRAAPTETAAADDPKPARRRRPAA